MDGGYYDHEAAVDQTEGCLPALPFVRPPSSNFAFLTFQVQLVSIFVVTQSLHHGVMKHLGLPTIVSQMLAGALFDHESVLVKNSRIYDKLVHAIFPHESVSVWNTMSMLGYSLTLYVIGIKMDFGLIRKGGRKGLTIGVLSMVVGVAVNLVAIQFLFAELLHQEPSKTAKNKYTTLQLIMNFQTMAVSLPVSHFPVVFYLLLDLGILNSEIGRLALTGALTGEIVSIIVVLAGSITTGAIAAGPATLRLKILALQLISPIALVGLGVLVFRPLARWAIGQTPKDRPIKNVYVMLTFFAMLLASVLTDASHQFVLMGSFIMGTVTPDGPPLGSAVVDKIDFLVTALLQPYFVTTMVIKANVVKVRFSKSSGLMIQTLKLVAISTASKITAVCLLGTLNMKMAWTDSLALGFIMSAKGIVDLALYIMFKSVRTITPETTSVAVLWALVTAVIVPLAVKRLYHPHRKYAGFQKRDVMNCLHGGMELKILPCIYKPQNISAVTNFLDMTNPTADLNPVVAYVLHLVKLVGRSHPAFVSHDLQKKKAASVGLSFADDVVWAFNRFQHDHNNNNNNNIRPNGDVSCHVYTAVSPSNSMHEDICTLALDKVASLIILPFHRRLGYDGSITFDDHEQRHLNVSIIERAPCSVAVLIDRGRSNSQSHSRSHSHSHRSDFISSSLSPSTKSTAFHINSVSVDSISVHSDSAAAAAASERAREFAVAVIYIGGTDDEETLALAKWMVRGGRVRVDVVRLVASAGPNDNVNEVKRIGFNPDAGLLVEEVKRVGIRGGIRYIEKRVKDGSDTAEVLKDLVAGERYDLVMAGRRKGEEDKQQTAGLGEWKEMEELGVVGDLLASCDLRCRSSVLIVQRQRLYRSSTF